MERARILVVDDEPDILDAVRNYLEGALGAEVVRADSGAAGLAVLAKGPPVDLVISDFRMPAMDGLEFLSRIRSLSPDVPRIMLTAFPDMHLAIKALNEAAIMQFLTKPVDPDKLLDVVRRTLAETRRAKASRKALDQAAAALAARGKGGKEPAPAQPGAPGKDS